MVSDVSTAQDFMQTKMIRKLMSVKRMILEIFKEISISVTDISYLRLGEC